MRCGRKPTAGLSFPQKDETVGDVNPCQMEPDRIISAPVMNLQETDDAVVRGDLYASGSYPRQERGILGQRNNVRYR